jgi:hypothetical protein
MEGAVIFVAEAAVFPSSGPALIRIPDPESGLALWAAE